MFRRIVVGFDGSEPSRKALLAALELARAFQGEVHALAVVRPPEFTELEGEVEEALNQAQGALSEAFRWARSAAHKHGVALHLHRRVGHPAEVLLRYAEDEGADLMVMGRRGLTPVQRWMLGSVSERVLRYATCPVMVVH
ncbi:MAG: universal stress protein [Meiothermus sp.]|uniref:universal stress protein n=1 Tax=Meiothermus sp. TaxID=1955249 RepID=UPI0025D73358|nr:universal stress protein [Meiothermus sp.]MCS7058482.1 universal stress protein [Meiothermus sp.]MCS7195320.1 universal stress protein [Meiothermus sp.]MCX7740518.1 universal stress protein [Meiothermus sp.]MDW8091665.1 universal stress protein [Meiothermus sp.]MDW8480981.1 universal stress protein [Meiothermus sp.]